MARCASASKILTVRAICEAAVEAIVKGLEWLGIDWDGDIVSQYACVRHAEICAWTRQARRSLLLLHPPKELDVMREEAKAASRITFYDRRWRDSTATRRC